MPDIYITKEYYDINSLKMIIIKIKDGDKQIYGESDIVKINTYAILHLNDTKKLYKRINLSDGSERRNKKHLEI